MTQSTHNALVLFAHGSRNPDWRAPFEIIACKVAERSTAQVKLAFLEIMSPTLPEVLHDLALNGITHITVVPLFFGLGNHVTHDLRELIDVFQLKHPHIEVITSAPLGKSDAILEAMAIYASQTIHI